MNHRQKLAGEKSNAVSKFFVYLLMAVLTAVIVVPVAWVFRASVKQNSEFYGQPLCAARGVVLAKLCRRMDKGAAWAIISLPLS